ncbi:hypothetical protein FHL15_007526 [Xylaria flabelliformis]|uniref:Clr5 domain-containing protein n=1 Tax=Xylaria flabelliformis TaxID=2512241 RepID=A0A553HUA4_9PEZI|nr:hypothetical protein FHL15_007526 [Xylaria flabelliformis]
MPPYRHRQLHEQRDGLWKENESILRRLYLKEHKTLKDVKKAMESEYGFPTTPLSTYESKLRDLGLRKKMKRKDWRPVYQHYINSGSRHTALFFNGTQIPWDKAWREIRRSGARVLDHGEAIELPTDVVMRTPSPVLSQSAFTLQRGKEPAPAPWNLSNEPLDGLGLEAIFRRLTLYDIPSNLLRIEMLSTLPHTSTLALCPGPTHGNLTSDINRLSNALYHLANTGPWRCDRNSHKESLNGAFDMILNGAFDMILNLAPKHGILSGILKENSSTIQSATENMIVISKHRGRKDNFRMLIEAIGRYHPEWIPQGQCLEHAGRIGCVETCRLLLRMPNRSQYDTSFDSYADNYTTAVLESTGRGHFECAKLLCQHTIKQGMNFPSSKNTLATKILARILDKTTLDRYYSSWDRRFLYFDPKNPNVLQIFNWLLEAGANVDAPALFPFPGPNRNYIVRHTPKWWMPTILDEVCLWNLELYSHIVGRSVKFRTELTRSGVYSSAKEGIDFLLIYLRSRPSYTPIQLTKLLGIILTESLLRFVDSEVSKALHERDAKVIHTLLNYNINLTQFGSSMNVSAMLYYVVRGAKRHRTMYHTIDHIIKTLVCKGAIIVPETIAEAIEDEGIALLQLLSSYSPDFKNQSALALCTAISRNNYNAVSWLLNIGVNINTTLKGNREEDVTILAKAIEYTGQSEFDILGYKVRFGYWEERNTISYGMLEHLISRNIKLRANPNDTNMRNLIYLIIQHRRAGEKWTEIIEKIRLLLNAETMTDDPSDTEPCLSKLFGLPSPGHSSAVSDLMKLLSDHGISFNHSSTLTFLIAAGAPIEAIQRLLNDGVDVNAYCSRELDCGCQQRPPLQAAVVVGSFDLVQLLIQRGADVNQRAKGLHSATALQMACREIYNPNINLIKFLITNGADVNAPAAAAPEWGLTAFQEAAMDGNFEVALLLLDHGADINASISTIDGLCALDGAAIFGRLDMVHFLLELGALSHVGGESGYKGAILGAEATDKLAIADMIRQHALRNGRVGEELYAHHSKWTEFSSSYDSSSDSDDSSDDSEIGLEDQNHWEGLQYL